MAGWNPNNDKLCFFNHPANHHDMFDALEFEMAAIRYFEEWTEAGYQITIGRDLVGYFIKLDGHGAMTATFHGFDSLSDLLAKFLIAIQSGNPMTAPNVMPLLALTTWKRLRQV